MKKFLIFSLVLVLIFGLTGLASASTKGELLIWADEERAELMEDLGEEFEEDFGIPVSISEVPFGDIRDNMRVEAPSGEGPDIIVGAHDWVGELVNNGLIASIDLDDKKDDFMPVALDAFSWEEEVYGLPYTIESVGLIYNKDMVSEPPENFEEFEEIIKNITDEDEEVYGFALPQPDPYHTFPFMSATGGYVFGRDENDVLDPTDIGLNNEGAVTGLEKLAKLYRDDLVPYLDFQSMSELFSQERLAMMITGPWELANIREAGINYGFTQIPKIDGNEAKPFVGVQGFMISEFSENKMLARTFLMDYIATKDTMTKLYEIDNRPPVYEPATEVAEEDEDTLGVLESAEAGTPMPNIPEMNAVWESWENALEVTLSQDEDVKDALDNAVEQIEEAIEESSD
ncbi:MAG: sugar ABC transporter substrate-binding protein [Halanaerobiales bacterium]